MLKPAFRKTLWQSEKDGWERPKVGQNKGQLNVQIKADKGVNKMQSLGIRYRY